MACPYFPFACSQTLFRNTWLLADSSPLVIARVFSEAIFFIMPDSIKVFVMDKLYSVYIMTNKNNTVLCTGVTNNLKRRVYEHREKRVEGFTKKYNIRTPDLVEFDLIPN